MGAEVLTGFMWAGVAHGAEDLIRVVGGGALTGLMGTEVLAGVLGG
jgi:hypothetical protein